MKNPCEECIVRTMCKTKFDKYYEFYKVEEWEVSVVEFADTGSDCPLIKEYIRK